MRLFTDLEEIKYLGDSCVVLGFFDGVHKGHQALIKTCLKVAEEKGLTPVLFTFSNHPINAITGEEKVKSITDFDTKCRIIEDLGIHAMVCVPFDDAMRTTEPEVFIKDILVNFLHAKHLVCGFNYSFGIYGKGKPDLLKELGKTYGYEVSVVEEVTIDGATVSSTRIRAALEQGDFEAYRMLTGRSYEEDHGGNQL